jgi:hypothetical protein
MPPPAGWGVAPPGPPAYGAPPVPGSVPAHGPVPPGATTKSGVPLWVWLVVAAALLIPIAIVVSAVQDRGNDQERIGDFVTGIGGVDPSANDVDESTGNHGPDPQLNALWDSCAEGDGGACDSLVTWSAMGSNYEEFGKTCGHRFDSSDYEGSESCRVRMD